MPWKPAAPTDLQTQNDAVWTQICCLRRELEDREGAVGRLELLLHERLTKIDALTAQVDQLRHRNKQLDEEAERLAAIIRIMPQLDPAMLAPK